MKWLLTTFIALLVLTALQPWLNRLGIGRLPGDLRFKRNGREYVLPFLPGPIDRAPTWNIPYQPRLDWQLWFAGYSGRGQQRWLERLTQRLLEGSPHVVALFRETPGGARPTICRSGRSTCSTTRC